jgi:anti-sigma-K factor RskA
MDFQKYIASGIVERYALGLNTDEEKLEFENLAIHHPELLTEAQAIRDSLEGYARMYSKTPPASIKSKIWEAISTVQETQNSSRQAPPVIRLQATEMSSRRFSYAAAAVLLFLVGSIALNFIFYTGWKRSEQTLLALSTENSFMASRLKIQRTGLLQMQHDLVILQKADLIKMEMKGAGPATDAKAMVYCDAKTNEIFLDIKKLPAPPDSMQYQFWAIVKGKPVDAGMIELCAVPDTCGIHKMTSIPDAHAFAISLERKGGNPEPKGAIYASYGI